METQRTVVHKNISIEVKNHYQTIKLTVEPLKNHETDPLFLVLFTDIEPPLTPSETTAARRVSGEPDIDHLDRELRDTRERLQATVEEYETALEELKTANEEMVSINEELQSTNEELETSKEELQSV